MVYGNTKSIEQSYVNNLNSFANRCWKNAIRHLVNIALITVLLFLGKLTVRQYFESDLLHWIVFHSLSPH